MTLDERHITMMKAEAEKHGLIVEAFRDGEDGTEAIFKHRWEVTDEDESEGLYFGDEGILTATVVGAQEYNNERVMFGLAIKDQDGTIECKPFENVDVIS